MLLESDKKKKTVIIMKRILEVCDYCVYKNVTKPNHFNIVIHLVKNYQTKLLITSCSLIGNYVHNLTKTISIT